MGKPVKVKEENIKPVGLSLIYLVTLEVHCISSFYDNWRIQITVFITIVFRWLGNFERLENRESEIVFTKASTGT
jgi:hypothetical protein